MDQENNHTPSTRMLTFVLVGVLCFVTLMLAFSAGVFVGEKKAEFSFSWAENYHQNFGGPRKGIFGNFPDRDFIGGHGIFGAVMKIDDNNIIIKGKNNVEETVVVSDQTTMVNNTGTITLSDIKVNDSIVIIGSPDASGKIQAKFIRILPPGTSMILQMSNIEI